MSKSKKYPSQQMEQYIVRMPDGLRDRIRNAAEKNGRSMNAEIIDVLLEAFPPVMGQSDLHHSTIAELANAKTMEDISKVLEDANHIAERLDFPFRYEIGYKFGDKDNKQLVIIFDFKGEQGNGNALKAAIDIPKK